MSKFQIGDKVRCVSDNCSASRLTLGDTYLVSSVTGELLRLHGVLGDWSACRFEKVEPEQPTEPEDESLLMMPHHVELMGDVLDGMVELPGVRDRVIAYLIGRGWADVADEVASLRTAVGV